jgi:hypothetical protein
MTSAQDLSERGSAKGGANATARRARQRNDVDREVRPARLGDTPPSLRPRAIGRHVVEHATAAARDADWRARRRAARRDGGPTTARPCAKRSQYAPGGKPDPDEAGARLRRQLPLQNYEQQKFKLQVELLKLQAWVKETGAARRHPLRGPRRGRQGRRDQALHGAPEPSRCARGGAGKAQ